MIAALFVQPRGVYAGLEGVDVWDAKRSFDLDRQAMPTGKDATMTERSQAILVVKLVDKIGPILAGHPPEIQGAVLADLLATWLAGYQMPDAPPEMLNKYRGELLALHLKLVADLVGINEARILGRKQ